MLRPSPKHGTLRLPSDDDDGDDDDADVCHPCFCSDFVCPDLLNRSNRYTTVPSSISIQIISISVRETVDASVVWGITPMFFGKQTSCKI